MQRLKRQYGLRGVMLQWFSSHLSGRSFQVARVGSMSSAVYIPSLSARSASVYTVQYTVDIEDHIVEHGICFHAFADDTHLYTVVTTM